MHRFLFDKNFFYITKMVYASIKVSHDTQHNVILSITIKQIALRVAIKPTMLSVMLNVIKLKAVILNIVKLSVVMLNISKVSVVKLSVFMLNVVTMIAVNLSVILQKVS
jgi:hypothetical protein